MTESIRWKWHWGVRVTTPKGVADTWHRDDSARAVQQAEIFNDYSRRVGASETHKAIVIKRKVWTRTVIWDEAVEIHR